MATTDDVNSNYLLIAARLGLLDVGVWCYWFSAAIVAGVSDAARAVINCALQLESRMLPHSNWNWLSGVFNCYLLIFLAIRENSANPTESYISSR